VQPAKGMPTAQKEGPRPRLSYIDAYIRLHPKYAFKKTLAELLRNKTELWGAYDFGQKLNS
jgi:hypothetical protein